MTASSVESTTSSTTLLTIREVAERLRCSIALVYSLCEKGKLTHVRLGLGRGTIRISSANIEAFIASCTVDVGGRGKPPASGRTFSQLNQDKLLKAWGKNG